MATDTHATGRGRAERLWPRRRYRVIVDAYMRSSDNRIFAAGDVAEINGTPPGLWPAAVAGRRAPYDDAAVPALPEARVHALSDGALEAGPIDGVTAAQDEDGPITCRKLVLRDEVVVGAILRRGHGDHAASEALAEWLV